MRTHYRFDHAWQLDAAPEAVLALLEDLSGYGAWWPAVRVAGGSPDAGARTAHLEVRAPLSYRLRITLAEDAHEGGGERLPHELRAAISGEIGSRDDVLRMLDKLVGYYTRHEPSSPIPILLERARRLVPMNFFEIMQDLAPDGVAQLTVIRGPDGSKQEEEY